MTISLEESLKIHQEQMDILTKRRARYEAKEKRNPMEEKDYKSTLREISIMEWVTPRAS